MQELINLAFKKQTEDIDRARVKYEKLVGKLNNEYSPTRGTWELIESFRGALAKIEEQHMIFQRSVEKVKLWG